ncbi:TPA: DUF2971 domain-containing protein [Aeromonas hydrophila]
MRKLYKYTNFINLDFLKKPTIRISVPSHLNDPFESKLSSNLRDFISKECRETHGESFSWAFEITQNREIEQYGIVSLSETSRNLLMWAHYADEHNGACIGIDDDFFSSLTEISPSKRVGIFKPKKVDYDNKRFDEINHDYRGHEKIFQLLSKKSDEWIYEKEHRAIIPLEWCDGIYISDRNDKDAIGTIELVKNMFQANLEIVENIIMNRQIIDDKLILKELHDDAIRHLSEHKSLVFIKYIDPKKINSLYLGCRFDAKEASNIITDISDKNHPLNHINIYKYKLDDERFELKEQLLYSP